MIRGETSDADPDGKTVVSRFFLNLTVSQASPCVLSFATRTLSEAFDQLKAELVTNSKKKKSNRPSASMADAGCHSQSPISHLPTPTKRCADRIRHPVLAERFDPMVDRCPPVPLLLRPPTALAHAQGRRAVAGWVRRCGRGYDPRHYRLCSPSLIALKTSGPQSLAEILVDNISQLSHA